MATGTPKARKPESSEPSNAKSQQAEARVEITYSGKVPVSAVQCTEAGEFSLLGGDAESANRLYFADNLHVLARLRADASVAGKVKLIYIDPPYATRTVFHSRAQVHAYEDTLDGARFVEFLRQRLILLRDLLAEDGSIYVHLDAKMLFEMKIVMDELFGGEQFRNLITRKKCNPKNYTSKSYGNVSDYILFYTKGANYTWNRPVEPWTADRAREYRYVEPESGRAYMKVPIHAPGVRNGETGAEWRNMLPPPGKHWQYRPSTLDEMDARGEICWSPSGNPRRKVYLDESAGVPVQDIWMDFRDAHNQMIHITGYPTEKNANMMKQIIAASSNEGDLVLDCFAGAGTTLVCAEELGRRWIGVDNSPEALRVIVERFHNGSSRMGDFTAHRLANQNAGQRDEPELELFEPHVAEENAPVRSSNSRKATYGIWVEDELVANVPASVRDGVASRIAREPSNRGAVGEL